MMGPDPRLLKLARAAEAFYRYLDVECWRSPGAVTNDVEHKLASLVIDLAEGLRDAEALDRAHLPRGTNRAVSRLSAAFLALIDRWGWRGVIGPDPVAYSAERRGRFKDEVETPFLRVNLAWRSQDDLEPHSTADHNYDLSRERGLAPAELTPGQAEAQVGALWNLFRTAPILGTCLPIVNGDLLTPLSESLRVIEGDLRAMDSGEHNATHDVPHGDDAATSAEVAMPPESTVESPTEQKLNPRSKALAAAYQLQKEGKPVSLSTACKLAQVDRKNVRERYPGVVAVIRQLSLPQGEPRRGVSDRRTGSIDAVDDDE